MSLAWNVEIAEICTNSLFSFSVTTTVIVVIVVVSIVSAVFYLEKIKINKNVNKI